MTGRRASIVVTACAALVLSVGCTPDETEPDLEAWQDVWSPADVSEQDALLYFADLQTLDSTRFGDPGQADYHLKVGLGLCEGFAKFGTIGNLDAVAAASAESHDAQMYMGTAMNAATTRLCPDLGTALDGYLVASGLGDMPRQGGIALAINERLYP